MNDRGIRIGEHHQNARLTDAEVDLIRELHEDEGMGYGELAKRFDVGKSTIADICTYRRRAQTIARWVRIQEKCELIDRSDYLDAESLAAHLGYPNRQAMTATHDRLPTPDTVFEGKPLWHKDTATALLEMRSRAIHAAFGGKKEI
ncbi:hypothetical protein GPA27_19460 [Aromatoleum toluolicum]|uniref:hypothetical protein n=1 Tax=Aromatoleum toluolicum TaxID=90060 RepID=UPI001B7D1590|nr:hypothetical protein [Aromatoleum toluolicum]NMF99559.2 hypothetical protein [Aromatoleum toluolicum]